MNNSNAKTKVYQNAVIKSLEEFDCINQKKREITSILYDSEGNVIFTGKNREHEINWEFVIQETVGEVVLLFVCKLSN